MIFSIDDESFKSRIALIDGPTGEQWSYQRLCNEVRLRQKALQTSKRALVFHFCENTPTAVAWYLAAIEAGQTIGLFPGNLDAALCDRLLEAFDPEFVLLPESPGVNFIPASLSGLWRRTREEDHPEIRHGLGLLLSTSGSTGSPKLVRLSRDSVEANARSIQEALELSGGGSSDCPPSAELLIRSIRGEQPSPHRSIYCSDKRQLDCAGLLEDSQ